MGKIDMGLIEYRVLFLHIHNSKGANRKQGQILYK